MAGAFARLRRNLRAVEKSIRIFGEQADKESNRSMLLNKLRFTLVCLAIAFVSSVFCANSQRRTVAIQPPETPEWDGQQNIIDEEALL
jgi:hypothetical protein